MSIITSKATINGITRELLHSYNESGTSAFVRELHKRILQQKVRFPMLEHAASILFNNLPAVEQIALTDKIISLREMGSYVLAGTILKLRLDDDFNQSIEKAIEYIIEGNEWYVCDIIGERVMGHALLSKPVQTIPVLKNLSTHENKWIVRSVGVATHYAVKKGLDKSFISDLFQLLLTLSSTTDFHTKKGIGWAAKTVAKFHPAVISSFEKEINKDSVKQWFKTKVKIGLSRTDKYAHRYNS